MTPRRATNLLPVLDPERRRSHVAGAFSRAGDLAAVIARRCPDMALGPDARPSAPEGKPGVSGKSVLDLTPDLCFENHFARETGLLRPLPSGRTGLSGPDPSLPRAPRFLRHLLRLWSNCDFRRRGVGALVRGRPGTVLCPLRGYLLQYRDPVVPAEDRDAGSDRFSAQRGFGRHGRGPKDPGSKVLDQFLLTFCSFCVDGRRADGPRSGRPGRARAVTTGRRVSSHGFPRPAVRQTGRFVPTGRGGEG